MNSSIKVGDTCIIKKCIVTSNHLFNKNTIIKITGITSRGYQFTDLNGNKCVDVDSDSFIKLVEEKTESCRFCNNSGYHRYTISDDNRKYFLNLFGDRYLRIGIEDEFGINFDKYPKVQNIEINYCPFCGRELK